MFCAKCGNALEEGTQICSKCGFDGATVAESAKSQSESKVVKTVEKVVEKANEVKKKKAPIIRIIFCFLALVVLVMFFMAAGDLSDSGLGMMRIRSVGGKTLEEAYYAKLGAVYVAYGMMARALGMFLSSVLVWLGFRK